jgi:hypothetical protein
MKWTMRWGSHIPVLVKLFSVTKGDVLELGMGIYSSPLLFWMCVDKGRKLVSYENSEKYFSIVGKNNNKLHEAHLITDWDCIDIEKNWDIVFIDTNPMDSRANLAKKVANIANFVVLHDTQSRDEIYYHYEEVYPLFTHRYDYTKFMPYTTVLSNFYNLEFLND